MAKKRQRWLAWLVQGLYGKWPFRSVRPLLRIRLVRGKDPRSINHYLRQHGYTSGDRIVVMLEDDWQRVADLAHRKIQNPLDAMIWHAIESQNLARLRARAPDGGSGQAPTSDSVP